MRTVFALAALGWFAACGPAVSTSGASGFDHDLEPGMQKAVPATSPDEIAKTEHEAPRPVAPQGKGTRTGTISRAQLTATLDAGPAVFLRQFEVTARLSGERFVGWELVQLLDRSSGLAALDLAPGDVLLSINGKPVSKPDQFSTLWESLRTAPELVATMWRGSSQFEIRFTVDATAAPVADAGTR